MTVTTFTSVPLVLIFFSTTFILTASKLEPMNRPGTSSLSTFISGVLIANHRSTSPTTAKSRASSWHWRPIQGSISNIRPPSKNYCPWLSRTGPSKSPHNPKLGSTVDTWRICPAAYPSWFPLWCREPPTAAAAITVTTISPAVTPSTPPATAASHERAPQPIPSAEYDA